MRKAKTTIGIDSLQYPLKRAKTNGHEVLMCEAEHLPFKEGVFEKVVGRRAFGFMDDYLNKAVDEAMRVHKNGGSVVIDDDKQVVSNIEKHIKAEGYTPRKMMNYLLKKNKNTKKYVRKRGEIIIE
ncbi:MAG: methyltransferase domain-containing protein [Nanoarchaeota archaeon]|nr:class I SAM-dependent methyltransferase [Nanoarchaeota archaeon]MBU4300523.1 class I SAM-dependent methyltransferase [Nanoarchaeota archaeon]MBU4451880.1 class I SAM-dependent methyltransferase [Nanoarchaeota archaeon]MCG2724163.1 class I SAM-dependent methyltransferase [archaeon]